MKIPKLIYCKKCKSSYVVRKHDGTEFLICQCRILTYLAGGLWYEKKIE